MNFYSIFFYFFYKKGYPFTYEQGNVRRTKPTHGFHTVWFVDEETRIEESSLSCNTDVSVDQTDYSAG